jgi:uncharacterized protein (DUF2147 family)
MSMTRRTIPMSFAGAFAIAVVSLATGVAAQQSPVDGIWQNEDGEGRVEIGPCAADTQLRCGKIVWIKKPLAPNGRPVVDAKNPDDALKSRPICELEIISELQPTPSGDFQGGKIYDPEEGKTYAGSMKLVGTKLKVTGSIVLPVLGQISDSETWTRVTTSFTRCSSLAQK